MKYGTRDRKLARVAYEAYVKDFVDSAARIDASWLHLPVVEQEAWCAAVCAALRAVNKESRRHG